MFEGMLPCFQSLILRELTPQSANQKELVADLIVKAKQVEYLINSLPEPEPEEEQVSPILLFPPYSFLTRP